MNLKSKICHPPLTSSVLLLLLVVQCLPFRGASALQTASSPTSRIARWNGGPLELKRRELLRDLPSDKSKVEKALRSWYTPQTLDFLKDTQIERVWLTWSAGLPADEEREQQDLVREYMQLCRKAGIIPLALISGAQLFSSPSAAASDPRILKDAASKPVGCSASKPTSGDSLSCYQADLKNKIWQDQAAASVQSVLAAGAEGIVLEGISEPYGSDTVVTFVNNLQQKATVTKPNAQVIPVLSRQSLGWFRSLPELFVEDGLWPRVRPTSISLEQGEIVVAGASQGPWIDSNFWLMAYAQAAAKDRQWHLAFQPNRAAGVEPETLLPKGSLALAVAESTALGGSYVLSLDDELRMGLSQRNSDAIQQWSQAAALRDFISGNSAGLAWRTVTNTVVIVGDLAESSEILNLLARRGVPYSLVLDAELEKTALDPYVLIIAVNVPEQGKAVRERLLSFARSGGSIVTNPPNLPDPATVGNMTRVEESARLSRYSLGKGQWVVYREAISDPNEFVREVRALIPQEQQLVRLWNAPTVFTHFTESPQSEPHRLHLLNYGLEPVEELQVQVKGSFKDARVSSAEASESVTLAPRTKDGFTEFTIPKLNIYGLVTLRR